MKILHAKKDKADIRYIFYVMQKIKFTPHKHKRYWISEYSKIKIPLPSFKVQQQIVKSITDEEKKISTLKNEMVLSEQKIKSKIAEVWGEI